MRPTLNIRIVLAGLCLLCHTHAGAADPASPAFRIDRAQVEQFARERAGEARDLLFGPPRQSAVTVPTGLDCNLLYQRRVTLMQQQASSSRPAFWDDPRNRASLLIGTVWTPALAYLPLRAVTDFYTAEHAPRDQFELDALRTQAAAQRCFER